MCLSIVVGPWSKELFLWHCIVFQDSNYPQLDIDDVLTIDESEREQKLTVHKHKHIVADLVHN